MRTIKQLLVVLLGVLVLQASAARTSTRQKRELSGFHGISVANGIDLYLSQKSAEEVIVEANADVMDKIITKVEAGVLKISMKSNLGFSLRWDNEPRKVFVSFKNLDILEASSGSDVYSQAALKLDKLNLNASSGSDIKLELEADALNAESSSGSDISLKGKVHVFSCDASSGSDIVAGELKTQKCTASASSGSDIRVYVSGELNADASSGGDICYSGNPKSKDINESSGGDIHQK